MPRYDIEDLVKDIETLCKAHLNTKVAAVEAEQAGKGHAASGILPVPTDGFFTYGWNNYSLNVSPAVGIFVANSSTIGEPGFSQTTYEIEIGVIVSGTQNDKLSIQKMVRYARALKEMFEENWGQINNCATREKIETLGPIDFTLNQDSSDECKIAGVVLKGTLG